MEILCQIQGIVLESTLSAISTSGTGAGAVLRGQSSTGYSVGADLNALTQGGTFGAVGAFINSTQHGSGIVAGVWSYTEAWGTGTAYGGRFAVLNNVGATGTRYAVYGIAKGTHSASVYGVVGDATNYGSGDVYGVFGYAAANGTGTKYGIYGSELAGGGGAALYAAGDLFVSGSKSAIVVTSHGERLMYAVEATEVWFEDIGRAQLNNGYVHIELDPLFLETVVIGLDNPMQVFVQLNGDCNGSYVTTGTTGFDVNELQNGSSNATFTYRVMAKRKGYADERMRETDAGKYDINLYPERKAEIEAYWNEQEDQKKPPVHSIE